MTNKQIELSVKQALVDALSLEIAAAGIKNEDSFMDPPLYLDSLAKLRIFTYIEEALDTLFKEEDFINAPPFITVSDLIEFVNEKLPDIKEKDVR